MSNVKERLEKIIWDKEGIDKDFTSDGYKNWVSGLAQAILTELPNILKTMLPEKKEIPKYIGGCDNCDSLNCDRELGWNAYKDKVDELFNNKKKEQ